MIRRGEGFQRKQPMLHP